MRVARVLVDDWARILHRPPTASPVELGTGVLWVSTGTHPCGPSPRQGGEGTRAPALHTLDDVPRFRGDEEYRAVLLHPSSTCFVSTIWSTLGAHSHLTAGSRHRRLYCLLRETCWIPFTVLRLHAALVFCLSSLYAFRYDDSLQAKREGVDFSELEHPGYSVNGFTW